MLSVPVLAFEVLGTGLPVNGCGITSNSQEAQVRISENHSYNFAGTRQASDRERQARRMVNSR
jgi:hypothetical protein